MNNATKVQHFLELHQQNEPLMIGNVWNVPSARVFQKAGFQAIATSSAAVAEALGYRDGEELSFEEYLFIVKRIRASVDLPLSVDLETGFGKTTGEVISNIEKLSQLGVVGINIEDSSVANGVRRIHDAGTFSKKLTEIVVGLKSRNIPMFINTRCDTFLLRMADARDEAIRRMNIYEQTGINGIFLPCITDINDIKATASATRLPLNVLCMPNLPDFELLGKVGVKRISMGDFAYAYLYKDLDRAVRKVMADGSFAAFF
jgi:2-methylisocitrate lyase-like PEP mutase family enzyme